MTLAMPGTTEPSTTEPSTIEPASPPWRETSRTVAGLAALAISLVGWLGWIGWRVSALPAGGHGDEAVGLSVLLLEVVGVVVGVVVAWGLTTARRPRCVLASGRNEGPAASHRFAHVLADIVGRTRAEDLHRDVRVVARAAPRPRRRPSADWAIAAALVDGPRRLAMVTLVTIALLVGASPMAVPPLPALIALAVGASAMSAAHVLLSNRRIAVGDRVRWTYSSLGEIVVREDVDGVAPRCWVGTVATVVALDLALALRGISDRWTHGLPAMDGDQRKVVMTTALVLLLGAVFTLVTTPSPELDNSHLVARRLEERTARQTLLTMAMLIGAVGLFAGIFTGNVDAADHDPGRIEHISQREQWRSVDD